MLQPAFWVTGKIIYHMHPTCCFKTCLMKLPEIAGSQTTLSILVHWNHNLEDPAGTSWGILLLMVPIAPSEGQQMSGAFQSSYAPS